LRTEQVDPFAGQGVYISRTIQLPPQAFHSKMRIRFRITEAHGYHINWHVDDIEVRRVEGDCNDNGVLDICEANDGLIDDCNGNGIPDECDLNDLHLLERVDFETDGWPNTVVIVDADGDHVNEVVFTERTFSHFGESGRVTLLDNDGFGLLDHYSPSSDHYSSFVVGSQAEVADFPRTIKAADLNGDGLPDFVMSHRLLGGISVVRNLGGSWWGFREADYYPISAQGFTVTGDVAIDDFDSDGDLDIAVGVDEGLQAIEMLLNDGKGVFSLGPQFPIINGVRSMITVDVNGDGDRKSVV